MVLKNNKIKIATKIKFLKDKIKLYCEGLSNFKVQLSKWHHCLSK
jgi:hypothetical protein